MPARPPARPTAGPTCGPTAGPTCGPTARPTARPTVSLIVPFAGAPAALSALMARLDAVDRREGDEVIVADNRGAAAVDVLSDGVRVVRACGIASPAFARNQAVAVARGEWIVMIDADTHPIAGLLDLYFAPMPDQGTAVLGGGIVDRPGGESLAARHSAARGQMSDVRTLDRGAWGYAQSANMAVRRSAFEAVGGFDADARAGEDADLCFRLRDAGWMLESRPDARVIHDSRATLGGLLEQLWRHGAGAQWAQRRHPGSFPPPTPLRFTRRIARHVAAAAAASARRNWQAAQTELITVAEACAFEGGRLASNRARRS